ncbi:MAG: ABC transporter substrate-binding protein [gamma proteobacterium symbiont of Ctena orbiculata]|nr:MAG: ABC transporter substrate-binding protein [gamma proteobacterium symbiont of Ctena orbiculata]PVV21616.1 MAG: ABC transporter substrate-binding protein [gamma proteobacterium symbiont of Ctena orbiculata]PVV22090.1 MAG: ABC transporter substrate-binding protein [gamma proteobacterium symbiont of Ctena orbiculata]
MQKSLLLLLLLVPSLGNAEPLRVFASVVPIQTFVQRIGGEHVDARAMVRPGFDPHTYDPTPQQISALAGTALYVRAGLPFEKAWMERVRSANPQMQVLDAREGISLREIEAHGHDEDDGHDEHDSHESVDDHEQDPHVWTSPPLVKHMAGKIRHKLIQLAPDHAANFTRNHDALLAELDALDAELNRLLDPLVNRKFMVFHPAWGYFADHYRLIQVPIEHEGKSPGARTLAALIEQAKQEKIKVVFVQPQFDKRQARQVAQAIGGIVVPVDPLAADYADNLRRVGQQFSQALQH